jgi:hypothetical protein
VRTKPGAAGGTLREILADHPFSNGQSDLSTILAAAPKVRKWPVLACRRHSLASKCQMNFARWRPVDNVLMCDVCIISPQTLPNVYVIK